MDKIGLIIKDCREYLRTYGEAFITGEELDLIEKKIQELQSKLEEANKQLDLDYVNKNYIPVEKVKDLIKDEIINISGFECIAVEDIEELLEDK